MTNPILKGKYALVRKIATGGMAEIFLAKQIGLQGFEKIVVIKRILPHLASNKAYVRMFLEEARTSADLHHSNIVHTFEIDEENGIYFMVMEFLYGQDLRTIFRRLCRRGKTMPHEHVVHVISSACSALHYVHTKRDLTGRQLNVVHRDVSPHNLIVTYEGETKLVDFGIAKHTEREFETNSGVLKGKYAYMSPEQVEHAPLCAKSDQFSLAIVAYELFSGRRLFKSDCQLKTLKDVLEVNIDWSHEASDKIPGPIQEILKLALSKSKNQRHKSCLDFRLALEETSRSLDIIPSSPKFGIYLNTLFSDLIEQDRKITPKTDIAGVHTVFWSLGVTANEDDALTLLDKNKKSPLKNKYLLQAALSFLMVVILTCGWLFVTSRPSPPYTGQEAMPSGEFDFLVSEWETKKILPETTSEPKELAENHKPGRLKIVVNPWANVSIDGKKLGSTPLSPLKLKPGNYELSLVNQALKKNVRRVVTVEPGKDTIIKENWDF